MTRASVEVNAGRLVQELGWWLDEQERIGYGREASMADAAAAAHTNPRSLRRILAGDGVSADLAERIMLAIDYRDGVRHHPVTGRALPLILRSSYAVDGRKRQPGETGRIKKVDFANAKLTEKQLRAIYRLHIEGGLSLRELCRRGWQQWGYASEKSALNCVSERLRSIGLQPRSRSEATARSNTARATKKAPGETRAQYKRRKRQELLATSVRARLEQAERIAMLRARHDRRAKAAA